MLQKEYRLPSQTKLYHPRVSKTGYFTGKIAQNNRSLSRFGFIISKHIEKRAVVRNRVRRVIRSCIEELIGQIHPGYDILLLIGKESIGKKRESLCPQVQLFLKKQGLLS